jgi:hypothetical protein
LLRRKETNMSLPEDKFPALAYETVPNDLSDPLARTQTAARIANHCTSGLEGMLGLIFGSVEQFKAGLTETGLVVRVDGTEKPWKKFDGAVTYQVTATGRDGSVWWILLNQLRTESEIGPIKVINIGCKEKAQTGDDK